MLFKTYVIQKVRNNCIATQQINKWIYLLAIHADMINIMFSMFRQLYAKNTYGMMQSGKMSLKSQQINF